MFRPGSREFSAQKGLNYREQQKQIAGIQKSHQQLGRWQSGEAHARINTERAVARESTKAHREKQRQINEIARSQSALARQRAHEERQAHQAVQKRVEFVKSTVGGGAGRVFGGLAAVGKAGIAAAGIGGGALAAASINQALTLDEGSRRLAIAARGRGQTGYNADTLRKQFTQTGIQFGLAPEAVMAGVQKYVASTGDLKGALANKDMLATVAQGEGADVESVFQGAAIMGKQMGVKNPKDVGKAFSILTMQGKKGSFELKDAAKELPEVFAAAAGSGMQGVQGVRDVGTLMQLAQDSTENGAEAGTAVANMFRQIKKKAKGIQDGSILGKKVELYEGGDPTKAMRTDTLPMLQDIVSAAGGDESKIQDLFDIRGNKAFAQVTNAYRKANIATGGGEAGDIAGRAAVAKKYNEYSGVSDNFREIQRDAADAMKSTSVQLEILNTKLKDAVASQLFPAFQRLIPQIEKLIPLMGRVTQAFVSLVNWLMDNPFSGIGIALGLSIGYEVAKARIAAIITTAITTIMAGIQAGGLRGGVAAALPTAVGWGGSQNKLAAAGTGLAIGAAVASTIYAGGIAKFESGEADMTSGGSSLNMVRGSKDIAQVRAAVAEQRKRVADANKTDLLDDVLHWGGASNKKVEANTQQAFLDEMVKKLDVLSQAAADQKAAAALTKEAAEATKAAAGGGNKPNTGDKPTGDLKHR